MNKKIITSAILSILSFSAMAETPSFDFVELGYSNFNFDQDGSADGFDLRASKQFNENFYAAGDFSRVSNFGNWALLSTFGAGYKFDFSTNSSFFTEAQFAILDAEGLSSDNGFELTTGLRSMLTERLEAKLAIEYLNFGKNDDATSFVLGAAYNLSDDFAFYSDYKIQKDFDRFSVGVRYNF